MHNLFFTIITIIIIITITIITNETLKDVFTHILTNFKSPLSWSEFVSFLAPSLSSGFIQVGMNH